jgi:hypothetical protein
VRAALRPAATSTARSFARTALRAALERARAPRRRAADVACRESAFVEVAARPSWRRARRVARERRGDTGLLRPAWRRSRTARFRVSADVVPGLGGASFTPARRALDSPMAITCLAERAPCLPSRT